VTGHSIYFISSIHFCIQPASKQINNQQKAKYLSLHLITTPTVHNLNLKNPKTQKPKNPTIRKMHFSTAILALAAAATIVSAHDDHYEEGDDYDSGDDYSYEHSSSDEYSAPSTSAYDEHTNVTYTTEVVTAYTTYCPSATEIVHGSSTYTVTEPTTLTISDCPCTVSMPVYTSSVTVCSTW
jgi:hypothetical protein